MKDNQFLRVSEKFYSIQGEGSTVGCPSIFLRLGGCNLLCKSDTWTCDTIEVWSKSKKVNFEDVFTEEEIALMNRGVYLIITGGEPLLHQRSIYSFLNWFFNKYKFVPYLQIETNGTIVPIKQLVLVVDYWNVSPKLSNSGEPKEKRINIEALTFFSDSIRTNWKFVVDKKEDVEEILKDFPMIKFDSRFALMPAGDSIDSISKNQLIVSELCKEYVVRYSPRLHINIWNQATGV